MCEGNHQASPRQDKARLNAYTESSSRPFPNSSLRIIQTPYSSGALFTGKKLIVDSFQAALFDMGVDLGRGDTGMAEHHLNGTKIGPMVQ
jgi:hypothetical protein